MQRTASGIIVTLLALGAAGCGGGDASLTRVQFATQANAICERAAETPIDGRGDAAFLSHLRRVERDIADEMNELDPPTSLDNAFIQYKSALAVLSDKMAQLRLNGEGKEAFYEARDRVSRLAVKLGLTICD